MKKIISLALIAVMVLGCISLAACGGGGGGGAEQDNGGGEQANGGGEQDNGGDEGASGETLEDILGLGAGIDSVYYDMVITTPGAPQMTTKMWLKQNKMKTETTVEEQTAITIYDGDAGVMYVYMPEENMAYKMTYDPTTTESAVEESQSIINYDYHELGTETIDGKECLVVEYTYEQTTTKVWIWKEHGFPIKTETTTAEGTFIVEYKNISFDDILDSEFELPAGVEIIEY